ncbi:eukaryotic translation initiation factor 4E-like [Oscarella lobularis]|uniref:eukaryotic translation initiation factor 4E-like n=1 Tax=Oscarella lobularis TaxID=121494 RepID=UPI003313A4D0
MATSAIEAKDTNSGPNREDETANAEATIKHPLQNRWCLWFIKNDRTKEWRDNVKEITTFSTVEDFWSLYNYIQPASSLSGGCDYCLFKEGIYPAWEDKLNSKGGRWLLSLNKSQRRDLDQFWIEVLMLLIGEQFEEASEEICGAVVNVRPRGDKLAIWTGHSERKERVLKIGTVVKEKLGIQQRGVLVYQSHQSTMSKTGSQSKSLYIV